MFTDDSGNPILVTEIQWAADDALPFPLCACHPRSSTRRRHADRSTDVSIALGNIVLADHGLTFPTQPLPQVPQPHLYYAPRPRHQLVPVTDACARPGALSSRRSGFATDAGGSRCDRATASGRRSDHIRIGLGARQDPVSSPSMTRMGSPP